jgi:tetratricopeptide (TPR) repeat protein
LCALFVAVPVVAHAAGNDEKEEEVGSADAKKKFAEGNERYGRGDYDGAIESFKAAIAADPKLPGPYRNLGLAYRALNRCADALPMYEKYLELKPESRFTDRVRREIDLCRAKMGMTPLPPTNRHVPSEGYHPTEAQSYLHVAANMIGGEATDEASVKVDGLMRGSTPLTIPVPPGKHRVHLERLGFENADATIDVQPGQRAEVELTMNKLAEQPTQPVTTTQEEEDKRPKGSYRKYAWALLGVAGGMGLLGAGFGIAESKYHSDAVSAPKATTTRDQINNDKNTGANYATAAYVGLAVGGAALVASIIIFIVDPSRKETHEKYKYTLAPSVSGNGGGIAAMGRF